MKKNKEVESQTSQAEDAFIAAEEQWQEEYEAEERIKEQLRMEGARQEREKISNSLEEFMKPIIEESFHNSNRKKPMKNLGNKKEVFTTIAIDIQRLVTDLEKREFINASDKEKVMDWFNGIPPIRPIQMNGSITRFVSLIADLMDETPKFIKNSKEFVYTYIESSFMFNGKKPKSSTIKQIMKPGKNMNRVSYHTNSIPNIQDFKK